MFNLSESNIHLSARAANKQEAIEQAATALEQAGYVEQGYLQGMLDRELQTSTFLGNGIAIPHGTLETRAMVKNTGVQIFQFPQGVEWGEGNIAYLVIAIAARSDEHLALLRQLTHVLGDEEVAQKLATLQDVKQFHKLLNGQEEVKISAQNISLNVDSTSLLTLTAVNAGQLQQQGAVDRQFIAEVIANAALPLGKGLWLTDSLSGNLKNALAFSRPKAPFEHNGKSIGGVLTIAAKDEQINSVLARLLETRVQDILLQGDDAQIVAALNGEQQSAPQAQANTSETVAVPVGAVIGTFTLRNEHGLHARPSAALVNIVKQFNAKITIENITRGTAPVSAKSLMKIVALGVTQGHRLRFVAEGDDARAAIEAIGREIAAGLGEAVSAAAPQQPDSIEESGSAQMQMAVDEKEELPADSVEGVFVILNEHGLHARPSALLVNEVKKYNASVAVQNLDRESQLVSAKSLMKIVALGAVKGHRLRFVATGEEAQKAIEGIGAAIAAGLGE
ncbi:phosphocarrier protein HPr /PTS system D-fructose-specific IIA component (F1P-forming) (Frc family) [Mesocricetibacter intestinalis]|uniref:Multiphosphoryl transfer protein n=1 Tax=Mesocricetibacter intestinalis TaxID=1521930 RepID=A0A4R6VF20_9PAST|nr:fused PTS fructose transporter subunit IIA/HPr protein [Mesocricetibacter intestinalis]TDQ59359.1 phosphocarrier protein HPr /PTS system D-fructose-specific IIA component (F1P-forming) (Frc family) [Mesocricetibacter intestinalis]